jgi:hypothetical protein
MKHLRAAWGVAIAVTVFLGAASPAAADDDRFSVHGFGNQDYAKSTANSFEQSGPSGTWDNNFLGLVMSATVNDRSKVWAQLQANSTEQARFTWMFVDYQVSENLSAHVGRVKFPWGVYNEFIDTRALQLSVGVPSVYSGEADMAYDAYNGVGVDYTLRSGKSGTLMLQGFFGNIYNPPSPISTPAFPGQIGNQDGQATAVDHHVIGGKVTWETPIDGLRLMLSANQTRIASTADNGQIPNQNGDENRVLFSIDYVTEKLDIKSELNLHKYPGLAGFADQKSRAYYVQFGIPRGMWTPYMRYDSIVTDINYSSDPSFYQRSVVLGVNRKIHANLNLRIEDSLNHGYGLPAVAGETARGAGKVNWQLFAASVNFMF